MDYVLPVRWFHLRLIADHSSLARKFRPLTMFLPPIVFIAGLVLLYTGTPTIYSAVAALFGFTDETPIVDNIAKYLFLWLFLGALYMTVFSAIAFISSVFSRIHYIGGSVNNDHALEIIEWCRSHESIDRYRREVVKQRELLGFDYFVMKTAIFRINDEIERNQKINEVEDFEARTIKVVNSNSELFETAEQSK